MSKKNSGDGEMVLASSRSPIAALSRGVPPELMAIGSMLCVQLGAALAVPVIAAIGPATTTALRLFWSGIMLAFFVRPRFSRMTPYQWLCGASLGVVTATMTSVTLLRSPESQWARRRRFTQISVWASITPQTNATFRLMMSPSFS